MRVLALFVLSDVWVGVLGTSASNVAWATVV